LSIQFGGVMRDLTGSYELPFTIATLLLLGASVASFSIQEKRYSTKYQTVPGSQASYAD
jgi:NADH:ubiquinone oxidoreductase subunit 6 (subunit J)